jgi:divalent metal cation (Fe/Co/Zn/Cd) transporter
MDDSDSGRRGVEVTGVPPSGEVILEPPERSQLVRRGLRLAVFTVIWNVMEGVIAIASGIIAASVALVGFGVDSFVETASAVVVGWRFSYEMSRRSEEKAEKAESLAARIAGALLLALALYILIDSGRRLLGLGREPNPSGIGIALTLISAVIMPLLGRAKLRIARLLGSKALRTDAYESITCAWLSGTTLAGLTLNAAFGWWWADPLAALALIPLIVREGLEGLRGEEDDQ